MGRFRIRYEDVTDRIGPEPPYPELVEALRELGYHREGLLLGTPEPGGVEQLAAGWAPSVREEMIANLRRPVTVLRSPDGAALVAVGWFWDWPEVVFATSMADGALVETHRRWDAVPPWPRRRRHQRRHATVEGEMTRQAARGRSVAVVPSTDLAVLDEAHRAHVAAYADVHGTEPSPAPSAMDIVVARKEGAWAHAWAVARRYAVATTVLLYAVQLAVTMVFAALLCSRHPVAALTWAAAAVVTVLLGAPWSQVRLAYVRWWRPPYRGDRYAPRSSRSPRTGVQSG